MRRQPHFLIKALLIAGLLVVFPAIMWADGRPGSIEFSDGHKLTGAISLTPGKDLRLFTTTGQVSIQLNEVKELSFKPEKEEMREGFYFPNAGQATQAKTGEVYPTRSLLTEITLADGKILEGHLFTTTLYVESDTATEKVVLMAKQSGANGQKLSNLVYPTLIHFNDTAASAGSSQIDLSQANFPDIHPPVVVSKPDLTLLPLQLIAGKSMWTVPIVDSFKLLFSVEAADGIHVAWPAQQVAPDIQKTVETSLKEMQDFYDARALLGCFEEEDDVYSLVMMKRLGATDSFKADKIPWSLVILHWKYDADAKKTTLLNRVSLAMGRAEGNSPLPKVLIESGLMQDISSTPGIPKKDPTP